MFRNQHKRSLADHSDSENGQYPHNSVKLYDHRLDDYLDERLYMGLFEQTKKR